MEEGIGLLLGIVLIVVFILLMRLLGAWMLRINEVIRELKVIREILALDLTDEHREEIKKRYY